MPASVPSSTAGSQTGPPPPTPKEQPPRVISSIKRFWQRVTDGLAMDQLMSQFKRDAQTGFQFYRRDFDSRTPPTGRQWRNWLQTLQEMVWAVLNKLTPARRVLLLIAVVFLMLPSSDFRFHGASGRNIEISTPGFQFWSAVLLFVLLMLEIADRVVMKRDLEIARDIQSWLLPSKAPDVPGLAIAFATRPANTVAGDYYDVFSRPGTPEGTDFLITVADVAGKSIPAALLMATFQASLKTLSSTPCSLKELVEAMNRYACSNSQGGLRFTTAFLAEYAAAARTLNYINAGHNNPILRRNGGETERLIKGGLPLGIQKDARYETGQARLSSGDWLVIFTDGLVEAVNHAEEEYGEERLLAVLAKGSALPPETLLAQVIADVNTFVGVTPQHDDITCMLIKVG